ncbi:MAG: hypothetical protein ACYDG2_00585 [Ruminiclostridium sp.]
MKSIAKWYKWILLAIIFQYCVLLYINNVFLNADIKVSVTDAGVKSKPSTGDFEVPEAAQNISMSFNAKFGAYLRDGVLHVINVDNNNDKKVAGVSKDKITYFRWLPGRDMVIFSSDTKDGEKGTIQISTYEADSEVLRDYPENSGLASKSKITDIELSPLTNVVYAKINTSETKSRIIRFNVMDQYAHIMNLDSDAIIKECSFVNKLVYQNEGEAVYIYDGIKDIKNKVSIDADKVRILDIDLDDTLYIGILDSSGQVTNIYHQKITDEKLSDNWTKIVLKENTSVEDIIISGNGNIYINNKAENRINNVINDRNASYRGELIEILEGALISRDGNKINITSLKEY